MTETSSLMTLMTNLYYSDHPALNDPLNLDKNITYVLAQNGVFQFLKGDYGTIVKEASKFPHDISKKLSTLPELDETFYPTDHFPKIPLEAVLATLSFYKDVYDTHKTEAQVNFYYNHQNLPLPDFKGVKDWGNGIWSHTPPQNVSGATTEAFEEGSNNPDPDYVWMREHTTPLIETHSHHTMSAFESAGDRQYSRSNGLQLVFGNIKNKSHFELFGWVTTQFESIYGLNPDQLAYFIELPKTVEKETTPFAKTSKGVIHYAKSSSITRRNVNHLENPEEQTAYPEDWMDQLRVYTYQAKKPPFRSSWDRGYQTTTQIPAYANSNYQKYDYSYNPYEDDEDLTLFDAYSYTPFEEADDLFFDMDENSEMDSNALKGLITTTLTEDIIIPLEETLNLVENDSNLQAIYEHPTFDLGYFDDALKATIEDLEVLMELNKTEFFCKPRRITKGQENAVLRDVTRTFETRSMNYNLIKLSLLTDEIDENKFTLYTIYRLHAYLTQFKLNIHQTTSIRKDV